MSLHRGVGLGTHFSSDVLMVVATAANALMMMQMV